MSQVMSPLGALLLNTTATNPNTTHSSTSDISNHSHSSSSNSNGNSPLRDDQHQVLKLMSVSLLNESKRALNFHHSLALTLATHSHTNPTKMTFKSSSIPVISLENNDHLREIHHHHRQIPIRPDSTGSPTNSHNSSFVDHPEEDPHHSPISNFNISPSHNNMATISQNNNNLNDEDEVLSIGRDDDQVLLDCDSSLMSEDESTTTTTTTTKRNLNNNDNDNDNSGSDLTSNSTPSPSRSPENNFSENHRNRNYSSEDCSKSSLPFGIGYCSLSLSDAIMKQSAKERQQTNLHNQNAIMFSIANILKPEFGIGNKIRDPRSIVGGCSFSPTMMANNPSKPRKHSSNHLNQHNHHPELLLKDLKRPGKGAPQHLLQNQHSKSKQPRRHEPVIPIDLSRQTSNGSPLLPVPLPLPPLPNGNHHKSPGNHRKSQSQRENKNNESSKLSSTPTTAAAVPISPNAKAANSGNGSNTNNDLWPAWVYCTRYSDRPSSGRSPRSRRGRKKEKEIDEKRPRTAFTAEQLSRLKKEFDENRYLTEKRRQDLARDLRLHENQIKIWFQNKRAKLKKSTGQRGGLALQLMAQGLYNHSTIPAKGCGQDEDDEDSDV